MTSEWTEPRFSRSRINAAGETLAAGSAAEAEVDEAFDVLNNWRSAHAFPLNTFQMELRRKARSVYPSAAVAQRLKRVPSIVSKLRRFPQMKLARMQDLGGCRAVVRSVQEVARMRAAYERSRAPHLLVREDDYIAAPQNSGYRGVHLIYRFASPRTPAYQGLAIEIQLRSRLQHAWATAVETVGAVVGQALKSSQGEAEWLEFFRVAASAFSLEEGTALVPGTPTSRRDLQRQLSRMAIALKVHERLAAYRAALKWTERRPRRDADWYLLSLHPSDRTLSIRGYRHDELERAQSDYANAERQLSLLDEFPSTETVLVRADSLRTLTRSHPNYFLDTQVFLARLRGATGNGTRRPKSR